MTMNNQSNPLERIDFVTDIDAQTAANYSGGAGGLTVYEDTNLTGASARLAGSNSDFDSFGLDNSVSSIAVTEGTWVLYEGADFTGANHTISDASGSQRFNLGGTGDNAISSAKRIA